MITVTLIPILSDNYAYLLESNGQTAIVDPGEAKPIIAALDARNIKPDQILITHYHGDHVAGLNEVLAWHDCPVIGKNHTDLEQFSFGDETIQIIETPGHKRDHICFYATESKILICGDTLFAMGCGRILDGTAQELFTSLQKLKNLPDDTRIYCGHEYTLSNAKFCAYIMPDNAAIQARLEQVKNLRAHNTPTIPSTLAQEKETNVFLTAKTVEEFAKLRTAKDGF